MPLSMISKVRCREKLLMVGYKQNFEPKNYTTIVFALFYANCR